MTNIGDLLKFTVISADIARTVADGAIATVDNLAVGETVVTDLSNKVLNLTTVATQNKIKVIQCYTDQLNKKKLLNIELDLAETTSYKAGRFVPEVEQVSYIGFNGTSGNMGTAVPATGATYSPYLIWENQTFLMGLNPGLPIGGPYIAGPSETQTQVARGIAKSFIKNISAIKEFRPFIKVERVSNGTFTALTNNATVVNGSTQVTSTAHGLAANAIVRIGGTGATAPVYTVVSATTDTFELDIAYQGASGTVLAANIGSLATVTAWGIKFTGEKDNFQIEVFDQYAKVIFKIGGEINGADITYATAARPGVGVPELVQIDENINFGNQGQQYILGVPPRRKPTAVDFTKGYGQLNIGYKHVSATIAGHGSVRGHLLVYAPQGSTGTNVTGNATSLLDVLDVWASGKGFAAQAATVLA